MHREGYFRELHHNQQGVGVSYSEPIVSSLLHRIAALESSLRRQSSSHSQSLRDAAARTIQIHFRAFLVRRSKTLRQLKDLASIKSTINVLKSSVSDNTSFDPLALSHRALHLLLKLDSIQGDDPMIRDGKRAISKELTRFLDLFDGVIVKRSEFSSGFVKKNARTGESSKKSRNLYGSQKMGNASRPDLGRDKRLEDLVSRIETLYNKVPREEDDEEEDEEPSGVPQTRKGGFRRPQPEGIQTKVKKNVKFSEDGNVYYVPRSRHELVLTEDCDSYDDRDESLVDQKKLHNILRKEAHEEVGGVSFKDTEDDDDDEETQSDDEDDHDDGDQRDPTNSVPLPLKMEIRSDLMDKRKTLKVIE